MRKVNFTFLRPYSLFFTILLSILLFVGRAETASLDPNDGSDIYLEASGHIEGVDSSSIRVYWYWEHSPTPQWIKADLYRCSNFDPDQEKPITCSQVETIYRAIEGEGRENYFFFYDNPPDLGMYYWYYIEVCDDALCVTSENTFDKRSGESYRTKGAWIGEETVTPLSPGGIRISKLEDSPLGQTRMGISWTGNDPRMTDFFQPYYCTDTSEESCRTLGVTLLYRTFYTEHTFYGDTKYYYRVKACAQGFHWYESSIKCSAFSDYGFLVDSPPVTPENLLASDGDYSNRIEVTWSASVGATSYRLYRDGSFIAEIEGTTYTDRDGNGNDLEPLKEYNYTAEACNSIGCSDMSNSDSGHLKEVSRQNSLPAILELLLSGESVFW